MRYFEVFPKKSVVFARFFGKMYHFSGGDPENYICVKSKKQPKTKVFLSLSKEIAYFCQYIFLSLSKEITYFCQIFHNSQNYMIFLNQKGRRR